MALKRLANTDYMAAESPLQIYHQTLYKPVEVHWHEFYELGFVLAGQGEHVMNGVTQPLQRGSLFLLTPADFHEVIPQPGTSLELFDVVFQASVLKEEVYLLLFQDLKQPMLSFTGSELEGIEYEFQRLWSESQQHHIASHLVMVGALERILIELLRKSRTTDPDPMNDVDPTQHQKLSKSLIYLHHNFREPLTLDEVAAQVHLSPAYFSACFHRIYGASFQRYLQDLRLQFAMSLLAAAPVPISHVYAAAGFQTLSHFERAFKRKYGLSPRAFSKTRQR